MNGATLDVRVFVAGDALGELLVLSHGLSFWGGVNTASGAIIDRQHPQCGQNISGRLVALPEPRGSTAAPGALLDCIEAGVAPAGIILAVPDPIPVAAVMVAQLAGLPMFPVVSICCKSEFHLLQDYRFGRITGARLELYRACPHSA